MELDALEDLDKLPAEQQGAVIMQLIRSGKPALRTQALRVGAAVLSDDCLTVYLRDGQDDVLRNAALEMLVLRGSRGVALCIALLNDRDSDVVLQAAIALERLKDPRALEPLRRSLNHPNANVVQAAITAIGHLGHQGSADDLLPFLNADHWLQMAAVQALGDLRAAQGVEPLASLLDDPNIAPLAAESLARIGGPAAFQHLARHWQRTASSDPSDIELLAHVLDGMTGDPVAPEGLRQCLATHVAAEGSAAAMAAARCLLALGPGPEDRTAVNRLALGTPDRAELPPCLRRRKDLIGPLLEQQGTARRWGFQLAARFPRETPAGPFLAALSDPAKQPLYLDAMKTALQAIDHIELGDTLLRVYGQLPAEARTGWGAVLRTHRSSLQASLHRHGNVRKETRLALTAILEDDGDKVLNALLELPPSTRASLLGELPRDTALSEHLPWMEWLREDISLYGGIAAQYAEPARLRAHLPEVRRLLREIPHPDLIRLVRDLNDHESVDLLIELLQHNDSAIRPFLIEALGVLGGDRARDTLSQLVSSADPHSARLAFRALAACATDADRQLFRDAASHGDWCVRLAAVQVLGAAGQPEDTVILNRLAADPVPVVAQRALAALRP